MTLFEDMPQIVDAGAVSLASACKAVQAGHIAIATTDKDGSINGAVLVATGAKRIAELVPLAARWDREQVMNS